MKKSHDAVNYRDGSGSRVCAYCTMYRTDPRHCTDVVNPIMADGVCDIFDPKRVERFDTRRNSKMRDAV